MVVSAFKAGAAVSAAFPSPDVALPISTLPPTSLKAAKPVIVSHIQRYFG